MTCQWLWNGAPTSSFWLGGTDHFTVLRACMRNTSSQIAIASHKTNVYIDLSGWSPKYFPPQLVHAAARQLRTKVLFGTDYPYIKMDRWRRDFEALDIDPALAPLIYKENALRVLGVKR